MPLAAQGEQLLALAGVTDTDDHTNTSYGWQVEWDQSFSAHLAGSLAWTNEGHLQGHHRDGASVQLWVNGFKWHDCMTLALGLGPYVYFDTQPSSSARGYNDFHGVGGILSASAALDVTGPWSLHLDFNAIHTPGDSSTRTLLLGAGYHFGEHQDAKHPVTADSIVAHDQEIQIFGGKVIANSLSSRETQTFGIDYRFDYVSWAAWSVAWMYNPAGQNGRHNRIASELWLVDHFRNQQLSFSAGIGVYARVGSAHTDSVNAQQTTDGLFSLRADWHWTPRTSIILTGYRRFTKDDDDRDMIALGIGWRFGVR